MQPLGEISGNPEYQENPGHYGYRSHNNPRVKVFYLSIDKEGKREYQQVVGASHSGLELADRAENKSLIPQGTGGVSFLDKATY